MFYTFRPSTKKGQTDWGYLCIIIKKGKKKQQITTKILLKKKEWEKYRSGDFVSSALMSSQKIRYGAFSLILSQLKSLIEEESDPSRVPYLIIGAKDAIMRYNRKISESVLRVKYKPTFFCDFIESYIQELQSGKRLKFKSTEQVSDAYISSLEGLTKCIKRYEEEKDYHFTLDDITYEFRNEFMRWRLDEGCFPNTLVAELGMVRSVLKAAHEMELTRNNSFQKKGFVPKCEDIENVYLTPYQISELESLDISTNQKLRSAIRNSNMDEERKEQLLKGFFCTKFKTLDKVKDLFLIGVYSGQRISDYRRIRKSMIVEYGGKQFVKLIQTKGKKKVLIPLDKRLLSILDRYQGKAPDICHSTLNKNIKIIGEILNWTWHPDFDERKMGKKAGPRFCDMLSSHTARRTFATNAYAAGVPIKSIMAITGHSTEEYLRTYLKLDAQDKAIMAARDFESYIEKPKM